MAQTAVPRPLDDQPQPMLQAPSPPQAVPPQQQQPPPQPQQQQQQQQQSPQPQQQQQPTLPQQEQVQQAMAAAAGGGLPLQQPKAGTSAPSGGAVGGAGASPASVPKHSLYVGDLDKSVDEGLLYNIFSKIGPVASIRVCRDSVTRRSLGYAYVNYIPSLDPHAAEKALELLAYTHVKSRPMRIMWANRDASQRKSGVGNVFVKGIEPGIDSRTLHDTFEVFGPVTSAKVAAAEDGTSLGYGYVQYERPESAAAAVDSANGMLLKGTALYVAHYASKEQRGGSKGFTNLFVKNLPPSIDNDDALISLFSQFGEITSVYLQKGSGPDVKGFGFVNFNDTASAGRAAEEMNNKDMGGVPLYVGPAQKKSERKKLLEDRYERRRRAQQESTQGRNLYVKHLDPAMDDEGLKKLFTKFGNITSAKVMVDDSAKSRCFGFVCFATVEEASRALAEMNGHLLAGQNLYVAIAQPKAVRQQELERTRLARLHMGLGMGMTAPPYPPVMAGGMMAPQLWAPPTMTPPMGVVQGERGRGAPGRGGQRNAGRGRGAPRGRGIPGGRIGRGGAKSFRPQPLNRPGSIGGGPNTATGSAGGGPSTSALAAAPPEQQKIMLGERLYPLVDRIQPDKAAKITGMLLEMDNQEVLYLIDNAEALNAKVEEAVAVLKEHHVSG